MWHEAFLPFLATASWTHRVGKDLFHLQVPWQEKVIRSILVYAFLLMALRVFGRRELGQLTAFDLIVLLTLSNILQNAMIGNDNSLWGGVIGAVILLTMNFGVAYAVFRSRRFERLVNGQPKILVHDGVVQSAAVRSEKLTENDLMSAIRREGLESIADVHLLVSEPNGMISVIPRPRPGPDGSARDLR